ncbi:MAG: glycosyltransferase [Nanoarchaeota archaeon]|nr:glycosyltransferase family 2 protein [Nanoarchaeota archaeon]
MEFLPIIYLGYMFVSIYFLSLFLSLFFRNRKELFSYPVAKKQYSVSIVVPAWNEENTIENTVKEILKSDYEGLKEVIVVDDGSTDNTLAIARELEKEYDKVKVYTKENEGSKAGALNFGLKKVDSDIFGVVDADSYPAKDSIRKMVGFFDDSQVGATTCVFVPRNRGKFIEKLQATEYNVIAFTRKLLDYVDAIYVTPGPLALYRKSALDEIGGFDMKNMTEDIEATWHLAYRGYQRRMCLATKTTTTVPSKLKAWYRQRRRWNIGGLQCISKYKKAFFQKGMLGFFILPFFVLQLFLGLVGLAVFTYLVATRFITNYLYTRYSIEVGTPLITMNDLFITPSFLNYLGIVLFIFGVIFTIGVLYILKDNILAKRNIFNLIFYFLFYLSIYPLIMISALYYFFKGGAKWR